MATFRNVCVFAFMQNYLMGTKHPLVPVTCLKQGDENKEFNAEF